MKEINRPIYLKRLIASQEVPLIKIITGIRRCGKSYLLDPIYRRYLISSGVPEDHIIKVNLELERNSELRDPKALNHYVDERISDDGKYYVLLDEIQLVPNFEFVLNDFLARGNLDVYVTGSNSHFLSSDIITEFRGRSYEIHMYPLSFAEMVQAYDDKYAAWRDYYLYGGLPLVLTLKNPRDKIKYLLDAQQNVYLKDIIERYEIRNDAALKSLIKIVASSTGSLTNPYKLENAFKSKVNTTLSHNTIDGYLNKLEEAFLVEKACRYDVKGKQYIDTPFKYYFSDQGIRNSFLDFRQPDEGHIMENIIYVELRRRGYQVDVGVVSLRGKSSRTAFEIDFVANLGDKRYYIQSALHTDSSKLMEREMRPLVNTDDFFKKFIITKDLTQPLINENGIITMNVFDFLLDENSLDR